MPKSRNALVLQKDEGVDCHIVVPPPFAGKMHRPLSVPNKPVRVNGRSRIRLLSHKNGRSPVRSRVSLLETEGGAFTNLAAL